MCQYTYHHYIRCGHIATFTVDSCWELVEKLREGPTHTANCHNTERHDLLPEDQPWRCKQCYHADIERALEQQRRSMRPSYPTSDTSASPPCTQLEGLGDTTIAVTAKFQMTVEEQGRTVYLWPAPASPRPKDEASPGELPGSNHCPPPPPSVIAALEVQKRELREEKNSPAAPASAPAPFPAPIRAPVFTPSSAPVSAPFPASIPADDDVSDIWLEISQPMERSGFYDSDSDDTFPDLGEITDSEEEEEEEEPQKQTKEATKEHKESYFSNYFRSHNKSKLAIPPSHKINFRSAADPVLDIVSDSPRLKEPWYPFCNTPPKNEPAPPRTFLQSPNPRRTRISHILNPSEYDDDIKPLSIGTGFQSNSSLRAKLRAARGSVQTEKQGEGGTKMWNSLWEGPSLFGGAFQGSYPSLGSNGITK